MSTYETGYSVLGNTVRETKQNSNGNAFIVRFFKGLLLQSCITLSVSALGE